MAHLVYMAIASLDGYIEDAHGSFDWAAPDEEVHRFVNDRVRSAGAFLYGRRMYEIMQVWETDPGFTAQDPVLRDFAQIWLAADKIVYSRTLPAVSTRRTRLERAFDPDAIKLLKETARQDILIGGPELAAHAFRSGLVDEVHLLLAPVSVGGGKPALPAGVRLDLELLQERRFANGMVFLRYQVR